MNGGGTMTIDVEYKEALAGEVLTGLYGLDKVGVERPFDEKQLFHSLIELTDMIRELKAKIDKIEDDLDYHVHLVGDLPHNI